MKKLKAICIGAGYFGHFHYEAWQRIDNVELLAICDLNEEKAKAISEQYGFKNVYTDATKMFENEKPDFVDIVTPPHTHFKMVQLAVQHGVHIICQKPLAPTLQESVKIVEACEASNIRMMVHENFRFMPWYREIKKLLNGAIIGNKLHSIHLRMRMGDGWQENAYMNRQPYFREMKQLLMYETGIHFIDVFRYLCGEVTQVYARLKRLNHNIKGEDFGWVQLDFKNGGLGFIDANRYNESTTEDARLTFGTLLIEMDKGSIRLYEDGKLTIQPLGKPEKIHEYDFLNQNFSGDCVFNTQEHFVKQLLSDEPFETDVDTYLTNIEVLEKVYASNTSGIPVKV